MNMMKKKVNKKKEQLILKKQDLIVNQLQFFKMKKYKYYIKI